MARTSKFSNSQLGQLWHPALYIRISREDGDREESDSIGNQRVLLEEFVRGQEDMTAPRIYQDDGYTGTDFQRPQFQQMMEDAAVGLLNCIIVKDLSRLGRNYIEIGRYLEGEFPRLGIRFISLGDHLDSVLDPQGMDNLMVPVKNILNDEYARDISKKVRFALDTKRRQGQFIGSFAAYGYQKSGAKKGALEIDEEAAQVVRDIFQWFIEGLGVIGIAKRLNGLGIPNPTAYKKRRGFRYAHPAGERLDGLWTDSTVRRILKNKIYTGTMVQGRYRMKSYKLHISEAVPEHQWIEVENTHQPVVSKELFEQVQEIFRRDGRVSPTSQQVYLLSGRVRCWDCKRAMHRKKISQPYGEYHYYSCSTYKKMGQGGCSKHTIRSDRLEHAVLVALQQQIALAVEMDELIAAIGEKGRSSGGLQRLTATIQGMERKILDVTWMKQELYPDWKRGDITREEYQSLKGRFDQQLEGLNESLSQLQQQREELAKGVDGTNPFLRQFTQYRNLTELSRPVVLALIDMVYVREGGDLVIQFGFSDAFQTVQEFLRINGADDL